MGISYEGKDVEILYRELTGASESPRAGLGDAVLDGHFVEIKAASKSTLNQVRAVKYIPLIVFHGPTSQWYVVPPHVVVKLCCAKARGQHSENPFESSTLSLKNLGSHRVSETDLRGATLKAVHQSDQFPELRRAMESVLTKSKALAAESLDEVRRVIAGYGL